MNVILSGENRLEKIKKPLETVGVDCYTSTKDSPDRIDAVICDVPGTTIIRNFWLKKKLDCPLIYRMRGNYWQEIRNAPFERVRVEVANRMLFQLCDGVCVPDEYIKEEFLKKVSYIGTVSVVGVPKQVEDYPNVSHEDEEYTFITLTNFNYREKVDPIYDYIDAVNEFLDDEQGHWYVAGDGKYSNRFEEYVSEYDHVSYQGFIDPHKYLPKTSVMLHISGFDIGSPNAILEGLASGLPVVTNDFPPFQENPSVQVSSPRELVETLDELCGDPEKRREIGRQGRDHVRRVHSNKAIGENFLKCIEEVTE